MTQETLVDDGLVRSRLAKLSPESSLLLALSRVDLTEAEQARIYDFLLRTGAGIDWGTFLDNACRHGVLPLVGHNLMLNRLAHTDEGRTLVPYRWIYAYVYEGNRRRNLALNDEYRKVLRAINTAGIGYAIRKGPVLTEGVYRDVGLRRMGDLDVLLGRDDLTVFEEMVVPLGYKQGHLTRNTETVAPFDRRTRLVWQMNLPNSTLPFLKPAGTDDVEAFVLDPCFNLFQPGSGVSVDMGDILTRAVGTVHFGVPSRMLDPVDQVIDVCVQLHVEATTLMYIEMGKDLTLLKFLDLVELLRRLAVDQIATLVDRVGEFGCGDSVGYALHHASQVYPEDVSRELLAAFEPVDPALLDAYGTLDGQPQRWERGFAERLFDTRRWQSLKVRSTVPGPRAVV